MSHPSTCILPAERAGSMSGASPALPLSQNFHRGSIKRAKLSKSGIQHQSHRLQAHVLMRKWLSSALDGFQQLAGFSLPASSPRVLQDFTSHTGKQKQKETPWVFLMRSAGTACECPGSNSSGNMELENFQLPNSTLSNWLCAAHSSTELFLDSSSWENRISFVFSVPWRAAC